MVKRKYINELRDRLADEQKDKLAFSYTYKYLNLRSRQYVTVFCHFFTHDACSMATSAAIEVVM